MAALKDEKADVLANLGISIVFTPGGRRLRAGELCRNPALTDALETMAEGGVTRSMAVPSGKWKPHPPPCPPPREQNGRRSGGGAQAQERARRWRRGDRRRDAAAGGAGVARDIL